MHPRTAKTNSQPLAGGIPGRTGEAAPQVREHDCVLCAAPIPRPAAFPATQMPTSARMDSERREVGPSEGRQSRDCGTGACPRDLAARARVRLRWGRQCVGKWGGLAAPRAFLCAAQNLKTCLPPRRGILAGTPRRPPTRSRRNPRDDHAASSRAWATVCRPGTSVESSSAVAADS